jgi:hypothetical protein
MAVQAAVVVASETGPLYHRIEICEFGNTGGRAADQAERQVFFCSYSTAARANWCPTMGF